MKEGEQMQFDKVELTEKLYQQIRIIDKSIAAFSGEEKDEALRIATALRVLLHQTGSSDSLFHQLGFDKHFWMFDNTKEYNPKDIFVETLLVDIVADPRNPHWTGRTQMSYDHTPKKPFKDWWTQPVITCGALDQHVPYSRKDVVLKLANWEGGAHIGTDVSKHYFDMTRKNQGGAFIQFGNQIAESGEIMFYLTGVVIGFEFLTSCLFQIPDLKPKSIKVSNVPPKPIPNLLKEFSVEIIDKE